MIRQIKVTYEGATTARMARQFKRIEEEAAQDALEDWHDDLLPKHFASGARSRYRYTPRTRRYQMFKARKFGHTRELEKTGAGRRSTRLVRFARRKGGASATLPHARVFNRKNPAHGSQIDMRRELLEITDSETGELVEEFNATVDSLVSRLDESVAVIVD